MEQNNKFLFIHSHSAPQTPLLLIPLTTEVITGCTIEVAKGANKAPRNLSSYFLISCFTVLATPLNNTLKSSNNFMISIISFKSSFKRNKINPFPALIAPFPLIFLSNRFIAFEAKLLTNPGKSSLAKGIAIFVSAFFPKLPRKEPEDQTD